MANWCSSILSVFSTQSAIRKNTLLTLSRHIAAAMIQLFTVVLIARQLGPEGNGLYAMAILLPTMLVTFLNVGVGPATVFYIGRGELEPNQAVIANLRLGLKVISLAMVSILPLIYIFGGQVFPAVPIDLLLLGFVIFPVSLLLSYGVSILQGQENFRAYNLVTIVPSLVTLLFSIMALIVLKLGVFGVVVAFLLGQVTGLALICQYLTPIQSRKYQVFSVDEKKLLRYGWKAHFGNIMAFVNYRADIFLVNFLMGPMATGVYVIAVQFAEKLWMLSHAASTVLLPKFSAMRLQKNVRHKLSIKAGNVVGLLTFLAAISLAIVLYFYLEPIFGESYSEAFFPFIILIPGVVLLSVARIYANTIAASGKPEWNTYASVLVVITNIIGNLVLIPKIGLSGAALATSIAYGINFLIKTVLIFKLNNSQRSC